MLVFAGLEEPWQGPKGEVRTATIITTEANPFMSKLHDWMPAVWGAGQWDAWLEPIPVPAGSCRCSDLRQRVSCEPGVCGRLEEMDRC